LQWEVGFQWAKGNKGGDRRPKNDRTPEKNSRRFKGEKTHRGGNLTGVGGGGVASVRRKPKGEHTYQGNYVANLNYDRAGETTCPDDYLGELTRRKRNIFRCNQTFRDGAILKRKKGFTVTGKGSDQTSLKGCLERILRAECDGLKQQRLLPTNIKANRKTKNR